MCGELSSGRRGCRPGKVRHVELKVSIRSQGGRTIMSVGGEIDLYTAPRLHGELVTVLSGGGPEQIVVGMSGVEFWDSTGLNVLLCAHRRAGWPTGGRADVSHSRALHTKPP